MFKKERGHGVVIPPIERLGPAKRSVAPVAHREEGDVDVTKGADPAHAEADQPGISIPGVKAPPPTLHTPDRDGQAEDVA